MKSSELLKKLIKDKGTTIEALAFDINKPSSSVRNWVKGYIVPYKYISKIKESLTLTSQEYLNFLSAVQSDVLEDWRDKT